MRQGIQTGFKNDELRRAGCYFFALCAMAEFYREKQGRPGFTDEQIINFYIHCLKEKWITTGLRNGVQVTCFIENPVAIMNYLQGAFVFTQVTHEQVRPQSKYYVQVYDAGTIGTHFVLASNGKVIFDSWQPSSQDRGLKLIIKNPFRWIR